MSWIFPLSFVDKTIAWKTDTQLPPYQAKMFYLPLSQNFGNFPGPQMLIEEGGLYGFFAIVPENWGVWE